MKFKGYIVAWEVYVYVCQSIDMNLCLYKDSSNFDKFRASFTDQLLSKVGIKLALSIRAILIRGIPSSNNVES